MRVDAVACDDNSTLGWVEDGKLQIYSLIGEMDIREGEKIYYLLHDHDLPEYRERVRLCR